MSSLRMPSLNSRISEWNADEKWAVGLMTDQGRQGQDWGGIRQVAVQPRGGVDTCIEARSACAQDNTQVDYQWG